MVFLPRNIRFALWQKRLLTITRNAFPTVILLVSSVVIAAAVYQSFRTAELVSVTHFSSYHIRDQVPFNSTHFARKSSKINLQTGTQTPDNTAQFEHVTVLPPADISIVPSGPDGDVLAMEVCNGFVWGRGNRQGVLHNRLYVLDSNSGAGGWRFVKDFGQTKWITSIHCSQKSNYLFVGTFDGDVWRSVETNGDDDFKHVLNMHADVYENYMAQWSFADRADGTIWIGEYGGGKAGDNNDAIRVYASTIEGESDSWEEIFDLSLVGADYFSAGMHLHKILYNPHNDTLYVTHGDDDPNYIYKSVGGSGGNWQRIPFRYENFAGAYISLQPTSGEVLPNGNIVWLDDAGRVGMWLHEVATDTFTFIKPSITGNQFFFDSELINGVVYAPTRTAVSQRNDVLVFKADDPFDYHIVDSSASGYGTDYVAGLGNDGYVYMGYEDESGEGTKRYKHVSFMSATGVSIDPAGENMHKDPFSDLGSASGGWSRYDEGFYASDGGKYSPPYTIAGTISTNTFDIDQAKGPVTLSFWARREDIGEGSSSIRIYPLQFSDTAYLGTLPVVREVLAQDVPDSYWKEYVFHYDLGEIMPETKRLAFTFSPAQRGTFGLDALYIGQSLERRQKLPQLSSHVDVFFTKIAKPIGPNSTLLGVIAPRYPFDRTQVYTLLEATNKTRQNWFKVILHDNQLKVIDAAHPKEDPITQTRIGISDIGRDPAVGSLPPDTLYWAVVIQEGTSDQREVTLMLATQRSVMEVSAGSGNLYVEDLNTVYDGSSSKGGEEIGGVVLCRSIVNKTLSKESVTSAWQQCL